MAADFNVIKTAAVAVFAVIGAVVNVASDVSVCIHNKKPPFVLILFLTEKQALFRKNVLFPKIFS